MSKVIVVIKGGMVQRVLTDSTENLDVEIYDQDLFLEETEEEYPDNIPVEEQMDKDLGFEGMREIYSE